VKDLQDVPETNYGEKKTIRRKQYQGSVEYPKYNGYQGNRPKIKRQI